MVLRIEPGGFEGENKGSYCSSKERTCGSQREEGIKYQERRLEEGDIV